VTDLLAASIETHDKIIEGVLISDKVGDVSFINLDKLSVKQN